jgi:hypothetical protein
MRTWANAWPRAALLCTFLVASVAPASADWTPWQLLVGNSGGGLDISTNTGSLDYGRGARKVLIRYRNRYPGAFKGVVVLEVHDGDENVRSVNDSLNLRPGAVDSGSVMSEIATVLR